MDKAYSQKTSSSLLGAPLQNTSGFWKSLAIMAVLAGLVSWFLVNRAAEEEKTQMLYALHSRAESLMWSVEGAARLLSQSEPMAISAMLGEIGRQPGIAWIALVDREGRIIYDSYPQLNGDLLYTRGELDILRPDEGIQGRFSPDDPDIFETWKVFQPERLRTRGKKRGLERAAYIFVALDVSGLRQKVEDYTESIALFAALASLAALSCIALGFYIYRYRASRRGLEDARTLAGQIINSYPAAILAADGNGRVTFCNAAGKTMLQLQDMQGMIRLRDIPLLDWQTMMRELDAGNAVMEREWDAAGGKASAISLSGALLTNASGQKTGYFFILRDIGETRLLKKKLAQSERLSSLGKLASGLAHEIRNPLSSIRGYAHYLENKLGDDPLGKGAARLLVEETERLDRVLGDLLSLARPPSLNRKHASMSAIIGRVAMLARPDAEAKKIILRLDLPLDGSDVAYVDGDRLLQALFNIVMNAIQVMRPEGEILISLDMDSEDLPDGTPAGGERWRIRVIDDGPGMSEEVLRQIFTPYFTTRASGTGLGLPIAQGIVESHGGVLLVSSAPGHGSTFTIILPANKSV